MTAEQYVQAQLVTVLTANNPGADPNGIQTLATELSAMYMNLILPNLIVDLTNGTVTFVVPAGS